MTIATDMTRLAGEARPPEAGLGAFLLGLGTALPQRTCSRDELSHTAERLWGLDGDRRDRWRRINAASGIDTRHLAADLETVIGLSTGARMRLYGHLAPPLATRAATSALAAAGVAPREVTDLVVVSCTGFSAPGVDVELVERLGLSLDVRRSQIGFMGCFGAIPGLRAAVGSCHADPRAVVLVVCVELCSLHLRDDSGDDNLVATALFADGAAAAVVGGGRHVAEAGASPRGRIEAGHGRLMPHGRNWMTWHITDAGFAMTLSRDVPGAPRSGLAEFVSGVVPSRPRTFVVHPGGPGILDVADDVLGMEGGQGLEVSRAVLRRCGNLSSATVLVVLEEALARGCDLPAVLLAFGPGLSLEGLPVLPVSPALREPGRGPGAASGEGDRPLPG